MQRPLQLFLRAFYGTHPYGLPDTGTEESIASLGKEHLRNWQNHFFVADRAVAVIVGNFDSKQLTGELEASLNRLVSTNPDWTVPKMISDPVQLEQSENRPKKQTAFFLGFPAPPASDPVVHQYAVLQQILAGMGGRLFHNLRSKKSLAYSVTAALSSNSFGGTFMTYIAGNAAKEQESLLGMWEELESIKDHGIREEELQNAIQALIGSYSLGTQTAASLVHDYLGSYILGRPIPFLPHYREILKTIRSTDIQRIAREMFVRERSALGIVRGTTEQTSAEKLILV
jgi:zinc protease